MKKVLLILLSIFILLSFSGCNAKKSKVNIQVISDLHYAGNSSYQYSGWYQQENDANGSGKQMKYLDYIFNIYKEEVLDSKPDILIISGDLTFSGSKQSHEDLANILNIINENGTQVLVVPGNHDIMPRSYICPDGEPVSTESLSAQQFSEVYENCGYKQASSRDQYSLSYVYNNHNGTRIIMLDSNLAYGSTYGKLKADTLSWLQAQLKEGKKEKDQMIVVAHHSLLSHNELFTFGYQISNASELQALLEEYNVTLFLSGHLHPQHIQQDEKIVDIASGSFAVWPHYHGEISIEDGNWDYKAVATDVQQYSISTNNNDENLLNYDTYGYQFYYKNAYHQSIERLWDIESQNDKEAIADFCANANVLFFAGRIDLLDKTNESIFKQYYTNNAWAKYISSFIDETYSQTHISYNNSSGFNR